MTRLVGLDDLRPPSGGCCATVGTFDGVHAGHLRLIARTAEHAAALGTASAVVTWDRHPNATLRPDRVPPLLTTTERKLDLIEAAGVDVVAVLPFDRSLSSWPPQAFAERVLARGLGARVVCIGAGWRFGHKAAGDAGLLARFGGELGFATEALDLAEVAGGPVSSSRIRATVLEGDMELARVLLTRPFDLDGEVLRGDRRGHSLGYPTANLPLDPELVHPPHGVYAGEASVGAGRYKAAINVGVNPTFGGDAATTARAEAYLLDFDGDLYGATLRLAFHRRLRDELRFPSAAELVAQMKRDVEATRALC